MLGGWLFALVVGVAHGCGWLGLDATPTISVATSTHPHRSADPAAASCEQFCSTNVPVVAKASSVDDPPYAQPLIVASYDAGYVLPRSPAVPPVPTAHPPPGVPPFLRFSHLRL